ncbi:unnamed protein product [Hermetia illucens]|uniref:SCP domain-containing protein n=1 Tax=Hermetia illucens TaxID=343691 RepID=A0A7R8V624_HERIL|nr:antigen 5 like allergen Cul n 1-like [Hermetia illucens]CAD7093586.1 unnamed protein product [Hermetia illucens]
MRFKISYLLLVKLVSFSNAATDYCDSRLCPNGTHIACGNNGKFGPECPINVKVEDLSKMQSVILHMHNIRRNRVAGGNLRGYQPARRMGVLQWDNELAKLALLNAKRCFMDHDICRNTRHFLRSGQNIGMTYTWGKENQLRSHLIDTMDRWFFEYKLADMSIIKSFRDPKTVGHFTLMVGDHVTQVGCGTVGFTRLGRHTKITACNYSATNIFHKPVYRSGATASACVTGRHPTYKNLCSTKENINPNKI